MNLKWTIFCYILNTKSRILCKIILLLWKDLFLLIQKQLLRGVLRKRCSENIQPIYRRIPMPKCDFNKVDLQLYWNHTLVWVFPCEFCSIFLENLFIRTSMEGCFCRLYMSFSLALIEYFFSLDCNIFKS